MIITNHIREGMELARKYKLKRPIREAIEQHHGTDLVYYFYKLAKDSGECISEHDFRYPGPRPQTRETAILSLADACEAASRSLEKPTHARISELVNTIFQKRLRDGQLDECSMTFRELAVIRESFIKTLTSMLHARVAYPKEEDLLDENDLFVDAERKASGSQTA
jgi:membrane-associated HD superfamily phosphohydrolase